MVCDVNICVFGDVAYHDCDPVDSASMISFCLAVCSCETCIGRFSTSLVVEMAAVLFVSVLVQLLTLVLPFACISVMANARRCKFASSLLMIMLSESSLFCPG